MMIPSFRALILSLAARHALAAFGQGQEIDYLANFDAINAAAYSVVKDSPESLPAGLLAACANSGESPSSTEVTVQADLFGIVTSSTVSAQCGSNSICIVPFGTTFQVDGSINLGALVVRGEVEWTDATQPSQDAYLCAGYVAVEGQGSWSMNLQDKGAVVYIKDNGYAHGHLRSRAFGSHAMLESDYPVINIQGRELTRTWSVLAKTLQPGDTRISMMHDANLMGWRIGDRIGISPTQARAAGTGEEFTITAIDSKGAVTLDGTAQYQHTASFVPPKGAGQSPALMSAEVVNLSRNIVITGDDFKHVPCDSSLPEAIPFEETSTEGCRCASFRTQCTMGLHTAVMHGGTASIQNVRVERCGQRGVEGKYCLHFHKLHDCPTCLFKNNVIENSHQRGIIVHSTHSSSVDNNVLWNVRGAGIYIEDGNELHNDIKYNVVVCPNAFGDATLHGCTVPGTSNRLADTSDNHSGIFSRSATNNLIANRAGNAFNGMFILASGGRGDSSGKVCASDAKLGRIEGNTWANNGRFGTYTLGSNYAKETDQSILTDGHNIDQTLCNGFDSQGNPRGAPGSMVNNVDYGNSFVGHYNAGEIQHHGHHSYSNLNLIYWKETKNFGNGCSSHLVGGSYASGNMALPDQSTFIMEDTWFGDGVQLEANHHCMVGVTGVLCFPQYVFHNVIWKSTAAARWMWFQGASTNYGGVFTLSPPNAQVVMGGGVLEDSVFPPGFVSLVSHHYTYLLSLPGNLCILSTAYGTRYDGGILCTVPLRSLKIYSQGLVSGSAPGLQVEIWYNSAQVGPATANQTIPFHQIGSDGQTSKQGYSLPVVPGVEHFYQLSLDGIGDIPSNWVVEYSDPVIGNRWSIEYINLSLNGRLCGAEGLVSSHHDRRFIWSGDEFLNSQAWGNTGACATNAQESPQIDCGLINDGKLPPAECPELCSNACDESTFYCDCGSGSCKLKAGFTETADDLCAAARCENGSCSAIYLGGNLPATKGACICDDGWSGSTCQFNPCVTQNMACGEHGTCIALSDTEAKCKCDPGYSGDSCQTSCDDVCTGGGGTWPYGCNPNLGSNIVKYGCSSGGGCSYLSEGQSYPHSGFCTFKEAVAESSCLCGSENDCEMTVTCNGDGTCPPPEYLADLSPCNSVPFGVCVGGVCREEGTTDAPTLSPTNMPSTQPSSSTSPTSAVPSSSPTPKPTAPTAIVVVNWANPNDPSAPAGTYFSFEESDWETLFGLCQSDPCLDLGITCGDHGTCVATSETEAQCKCDPGYSGETCETTCDGYCQGSYPYGCNPNLGADVVKYGCHSAGGCNYLTEGGEYPYAGFCTFKEVVTERECLDPAGSIFKIDQHRDNALIWTGDVIVWPAIGSVSAHGRREPYAAGAFQEGDEITPWSSGEPTRSPSLEPSSLPSEAPTGVPTMQPSLMPSDAPSSYPTFKPSTTESNKPSLKPSTAPSHSPSLTSSTTPSALPSTGPTPSPSKVPTNQPTSSPSEMPSSQPTGSVTTPPVQKFFCASGNIDLSYCDASLYPTWNTDCNFNCNGKGKTCQSVTCPSGPNPTTTTTTTTTAATSTTAATTTTTAACDCSTFDSKNPCNNCGGGEPKAYCTWANGGPSVGCNPS